MPRIHVVFGQSACGQLKFGLAAARSSESIVSVIDDLMSGPLGNMCLDEMQQKRLQWWERVLGEDDKDHIALLGENWKRFCAWVDSVSVKDSLLIWMAENPAEYTGLLCVLSYVPVTMPVSVVNVTKAYGEKYNTSDVEYFIKDSGEVAPDKLLSLADYAVVLDSCDRATCRENWSQLLREHGQFRRIVDGSVEAVPEDYFDPYIIRMARNLQQDNESFTVARVVGECLGRHPQLTSDTLVFWRIRNLIGSGILTYTGSMTNMRECWLRFSN